MLRLAQIMSGGYLALVVLLTVVTLVAGPIGGAPLQLGSLGPAGAPIEITIAYGTEKREWLQDALARYEASNPRIGGRPVQIKLDGLGSREIVTRITQEDYQPTVVSPASMIQIELLRDDWNKRKGSEIFYGGSDAPQPLVITPLVIVGWQERAPVLWPNGSSTFWQDLQGALANDQGWQAIGGKPEWGLVKFGHTSPETSNSGIQTLVLLAYGYHNKSSGLVAGDITDAGFQGWLDGAERAVQEFGDSTGTFMVDMINFGPGKYDFVAVYENLAIGRADATQNISRIEQAQGRWNQPLRIYYPPANILSEHPYAILNAAWVTPEQREAAASFRTFLLSPEIQQLALQYGFRPANASVPIVTNDPNNPFNRYSSYGVQVDIPQVVATPSAEVLNELITLWRRKDYE